LRVARADANDLGDVWSQAGREDRGYRRHPLLVGAYDTHVHVAPDIVSRVTDFLDAANDAASAGMAGIVFKDLTQPSTDRAYAANHTAAPLASFGGIVLDRPVGGLNPAAVEACLRRAGKMVWMPVVDALNTVSLYAAGRLRLTVPPAISPEHALRVLDSDGRVCAPVREIVSLVAEHDAILCTGHISPAESITLVDYARRHGVRRMIVNHPAGKATGATLEEQKQLASMGAYMEHCAAQCTALLDHLPVATIAAAIASVGAERCILATDLGQPGNPRPVDGLSTFLLQLQASGCDERDLETMVQTNPGQLLNP
jgi:hypothetical protein